MACFPPILRRTWLRLVSSFRLQLAKMQFLQTSYRQLSKAEILALCVLVALPPALYYIRLMAAYDNNEPAEPTPDTPPSKPLKRPARPSHGESVTSRVRRCLARATVSPQDTDPPLLQKHSEIKSYRTSRFAYPGIRVFYRPHPQADQLPTSPAPLPLLVFIHGLGGSVAQFHPLLTSLTNVASCLAVDLPGCGASQFAPASWDAYTTDALVELLETVIDDYRLKDSRQGVVLIGHSMGSSLALCLASRTRRHSTDLSHFIAGLVAICPTSAPPDERRVSLFRRLLSIPGPIFDLWRAWDRRGGTESPSVQRFVGADADAEARRLQLVYNNQSRTPVWRRMASGALPTYLGGVPKGGLPGGDAWAALDIPVFLIGGAADTVTPPEEVYKILEHLNFSKSTASSTPPPHQAVVADPTSPAQNGTRPVEHETASIRDIRDEDFSASKRLSSSEGLQDDPTTPSGETLTGIPPLPRRPKMFIKSMILPSPATHALLYTPSTVRVLAALVSDFLATRISGRLSLSWQLQYFSREGKWDVKNLAKWKGVAPVSEPIAGVFRAMKTLRELDDVHTPKVFAENWGGIIKDVIDISHDNPVYDSAGLERAGVRYHKLPTVSKIPPTDVEVDSFIALVDRVRAEQKIRAEAEGWPEDYVVGVHCHYGFNRTGYFIVCYMVERCGHDVEDAIQTFAKARPNGIRHSHFLDRLHVRYSGLRIEAE